MSRHGQWALWTLLGHSILGSQIGLVAAEVDQPSSRPQVIKSIVIHPKGGDAPLKIDLKGKSSVTHTLELGELWEGDIEVVGPAPDSKWSVSYIYETSMVVNDEGAHLDLVDWKHFVSEPVAAWQESPSKASAQRLRFVMRHAAGSTQAFPFVTKEELVGEIKKHTDRNPDRWVPIAERCTSPQALPCGVGVSKVWIQIHRKEDPVGASPAAEVILVPPLGC